MSKSAEKKGLSTEPTAPPHGYRPQYAPPSYEESQMASANYPGPMPPPYYNATQPVTSAAQASSYYPPQQRQVLQLAKGATIRTTPNGLITIPPPPPGCAATPAQLAAMQGQTVLVKEKKNTFF